MSAEDAQEKLRQLFQEIPADEKPAAPAVSIAGGIHIGSISGGSQVLVGHQGDIHLQIALERLKLRYNLPVKSRRPQVSYKETIRAQVKQHARFKRQSGGRTRIVHVGRPWGLISAYDLVVTSRQYRLPERDNVLQNTAPLHRLDRERMARDAAAWARRLDHLPRPLIAVLVGGSSGPYAFTRRSGERLALAASALAARLGGSLLVTTSARTPEAGAQALAEGLTCPHVIYNWQPGSQDNPYLAFLGLADEVIVTADSMSMMAEACASGKPVHLFDLGVGWTSMRAPLGLPGEAQRPAPPGLRTWLRDFSLRARLYRWLLRHGPIRVTRDIRLVHRQLVESGRASWLGERLPQQRAAPLDDLARAVTRVHALMARPRPSTAADPGWLATPELAGAA